MALLSPFIGGLVDKYSRKNIMIISDAVIGIVSLILSLLIFKYNLPNWIFYTALLIIAIGTAFHQPCLQAVTPLIVPENELAKTSGYTYSFQSFSYILSPAVAAVLYPFCPLAVIIGLDTIGAVFGILTVYISDIPVISSSVEKINVVRDAVEGFGFLKKITGLFYMVLIGSLFSLAYVPCGSLYPLMSMGHFGGTTTHAGIAEVAFSVGSLLGGPLLGVWGGTKNKMITMTFAIFILGISLAAMGFIPAFIGFVILTFLSGFAAPFFSSLFMVIIQQKVAAKYMGRVLGVSASLMALACPVGLILSGFLAEKIGLSNWFIISGILTLICGVLMLIIKPVRRLDVIE